MTNKEAIATLKAIRSEHNIKRNGLIAIDLAIVALEKETLFFVKSDGTIEAITEKNKMGG